MGCFQVMGGVESSQDPLLPASDAGGVAARRGFKYQDHVAAHFVLRMIAEPSLKRVECETADDVLAVWSDGSSERHEYVQVKTTEGDKKWSLTEICSRPNPTLPTSLVEKSLLCDRHGPNARFRIVSQRDLFKNLSILKHDPHHPTRLREVGTLASKLGSKWRTTSPQGKDLGYWTRNTIWQVFGDVSALTAVNEQMLSRLAEQHGANPTHAHTQDIYEDLLALVARAAEASSATALSDKIIERDQAQHWWSCHLAETEAANRRTSKPYRVQTDAFFAELHEINEEELLRALSSYDAQYEMERWRSEQLAEYLASWLPEIALKASELVGVHHRNLREKLRSAVREIERHRSLKTSHLLAELLLHVVLRHRFNSEPIACKLFFQATSGTKAFSNAHIVHGHSGDELWLGRTTLATADNYDDVVKSIVVALKDVLDPDFLREEREVIVTLREPQHLLPTTLEDALKRNTPVDALLNALRIPILIAYDSRVLAAGFSKNYREQLIAEVASHYEAIKPSLPPEVARVKIHVLLVPLESVVALEEKFLNRIRGA